MAEKSTEKKEEIIYEKINKHKFFFETSLYHPIVVDSLGEDIFSGDVDAYSAENNIETTYKIDSNFYYDVGDKIMRTSYQNKMIDFEFKTVTLDCKRKNNDEIIFFILVSKKIVIKVGQYPSLADIQFGELGKKYDKVLSSENLKNYKKAIGLFAHSAGAGSFVYLRRIFENLIFDTYKFNEKELGILEKDFTGKRMMDKIDVLKKYLPSRLLKMKKIYGILSQGVHELSEEECLKYFQIMKLSIETILDQKIKEEKEEQEEKEIIQAVAKATQQLSE